MKVMVYDVETTGIPEGKDTPIDEQPHVVQLAWLVAEMPSNPEAVAPILNYSCVWLRGGIVPDEDFFRSAGITQEKVNNGYDPKTTIDFFYRTTLEVDMLVCHNTVFDRAMIDITYKRYNGLGYQGEIRPHLCTMATIYQQDGGDWPKLTQAYKQYVNANGFARAHDAMADVRATFALYQKIRNFPACEGVREYENPAS